MIELSDLFWLALLIFGGWYWLSAREIKDVALKAAKSYCQEVDVELLDESVVLRGFWFKRNAKGSVQLWRSYLFEFSSTGDDRYKGKVILLGRQIESVQLETHRLH